MDNIIYNLFGRNFFEHSPAFYIWLAALLLAFIVIFYKLFLKNYWGRIHVKSVVLAGDKVIAAGDIYFSGGRNTTSSYNTRISVYDAFSGKKEKRKILRLDRYTIQIVMNGLLWLEPDDGRSRNKDNRKVLVLDSFTLEKFCGEKKIRELLNVPAGDEINVHFDEWEGRIRLSSGKAKYTLDCSELSSQHGGRGQEYPYKASWEHGFRFNRLDDSQAYQCYYNEEVINPGEKYFDPSVVTAWDHGDTVDAMALCYSYNDPEKQDQFFIFMIDHAGKKRWVFDQDQLGIKTGKKDHIYPKFLGERNGILIFWLRNNKDAVIFAIDKKQGNMTWRKKI
jgi:hypothetical protein